MAVPENFQGWLIPQNQKMKLHYTQRDSLVNAALRDRERFSESNDYSFPAELRKKVEAVAAKNNISRWDVVRMFRINQAPENSLSIEQKYRESFDYVGCVHGGNDDFFTRLEERLTNPPDVLIFGGDMVGSPDIDRIKKLFYNFVTNRVKAALAFKTTWNAEELLAADFAQDDETRQIAPTILDGYIELRKFETEYNQRAAGKIKTVIGEMLIVLEQDLRAPQNRDQVAQQILDLKEKPYAVEWVKISFSEDAKSELMRSFKKPAERMVRLMKRFPRSTEIIIVAGNEDTKGSLTQ